MGQSHSRTTRLKLLNEVLFFLYEQYHYSPKALWELRMQREALEEKKVLKPTNLKESRGSSTFSRLQRYILFYVSPEKSAVHVARNVSKYKYNFHKIK